MNLDEIEQRISDPGHFTPRGDDFKEPITRWSARAVLLGIERESLGKVGTLATTALRTIIGDADTQAAMDVEAGVLDPQTARAMFGILRDVVSPFNPQLADELVSPKTEKARPRE